VSRLHRVTKACLAIWVVLFALAYLAFDFAVHLAFDENLERRVGWRREQLQERIDRYRTELEVQRTEWARLLAAQEDPDAREEVREELARTEAEIEAEIAARTDRREQEIADMEERSRRERRMITLIKIPVALFVFIAGAAVTYLVAVGVRWYLARAGAAIRRHESAAEG